MYTLIDGPLNKLINETFINTTPIKFVGIDRNHILEAYIKNVRCHNFDDKYYVIDIDVEVHTDKYNWVGEQYYQQRLRTNEDFIYDIRNKLYLFFPYKTNLINIGEVSIIHKETPNLLSD